MPLIRQFLSFPASLLSTAIFVLLASRVFVLSSALLVNIGMINLTECWSGTVEKGGSKNNLEYAENSYRMALAIQPKNVNAQRWLGIRYVQTPDRVTQGIKLLEKTFFEHPEDFQARVWLIRTYEAYADSLLAQGVVSKAKEYRVRAATLGIEENLPSLFRAENLAKLAQIYRLSGQHQRTIEILQETLRLSPGDIVSRISLGIEYYETGRYADAIRELEQAMRYPGPTQPWAHTELCTVYWRAGKLQKARECFRRVLELTPDNSDAITRWAGTFKVVGDFAEAVRILESHLPGQPPNVQATLWYWLGLTHREAKQWRPAIVAFQRLLAVNPGRPDALLWLAQAYRQVGKLDEAAGILEGLTVTADLHIRVNALLELAACKTDQGRWAEAARLYAALLALEPNSQAAQSGYKAVRHHLSAP